MFSERWSALLLVAGLTACGTLPDVSEPGTHLQAFQEALATEPKVCRQHREFYVQGFKTNVRAISEDNARLGNEAHELLKRSEQLLATAGLNEASCRRPYCIIEPLQSGGLDSWCGYRIEADDGEELYQWLNWSDERVRL